MDKIREALQDINQQPNITSDRVIAGEPGQEFVFRSIYDFEQETEKKEDKNYIFIALLWVLALAGVAFAIGKKKKKHPALTAFSRAGYHFKM